MGYEVHITRKDFWSDESGPDLSLEEWIDYVKSDPDMRLDGFAETRTPDGQVLRIESPGLAVWVAYSKHQEDGNKAWFDHLSGSVDMKNPDEEILGKMFEIATALGGKVQGDDGEYYDADGKPVDESSTSGGGRPWWKFWS